ncbi:serine protease inhibitor, putative [Ichthyophthirius multifiliis]|uniref:Serine protease inhibitor, putative n=1 Tax=Ichthyophthirius multifiliis TaxID=5932 RepID=G0QSV7_ICHMU|nr:serine protease inhibitor, putative [Ichthyophthirius multifiliis]EGR31698.1 serine protease inhibitor, putative [Ichthyophthirius multifiliis]|eukprot:XP_004035184.1 serine protease inhibitor, putative [Ichthyophthirius multifiliis]
MQEKHFPELLYQVNFENYFEQIRQQINKWVELQICNNIQNLISEESIDSLTQMVLVNAIYFKGEWVYKFENKNIVKEVFFLENNGDQVQVDMMKNSQKIYYGENIHCQYIQLPYKGKQYAMYLFKPKNMTLQQIEQNNLNQNTLNEVQTNLQYVQVNIKLPKFKINPSKSTSLIKPQKIYVQLVVSLKEWLIFLI